jgi:hypothetical protein
MAAVPMQKSNPRVPREVSALRTRELKTNIAVLNGVLAGGLPGTSGIRSKRVAAVMAERLELLRRELAFRDKRDERNAQSERASPKSRARHPRPDAQRIHAKLSVMQNQGVQVLMR